MMRAQLVLPLLAVAAISSPVAVCGCTDDEGCSLNGVCDLESSLCVCDPAWEGDTCSRLALLPAPADCGYHRFDEGGAVASWGGTVMEDPEGGTWHMVRQLSLVFSCRRSQSCVLLLLAPA